MREVLHNGWALRILNQENGLRNDEHILDKHCTFSLFSSSNFQFWERFLLESDQRHWNRVCLEMVLKLYWCYPYFCSGLFISVVFHLPTFKKFRWSLELLFQRTSLSWVSLWTGLHKPMEASKYSNTYLMPIVGEVNRPSWWSTWVAFCFFTVITWVDWCIFSGAATACCKNVCAACQAILKLDKRKLFRKGESLYTLRRKSAKCTGRGHIVVSSAAIVQLSTLFPDAIVAIVFTKNLHFHSFLNCN